jgi:ABC-type dipeptide/oligopeptide/nickel transport system ATPase component
MDLLNVSGLHIGLCQAAGVIVRGVDFTLKESSALAIVGESGSGKTITCKSIMRLLNPKIFTVSGSIRYKGTELLCMKEKAIRKLRGNKMAMIFQNPMTAFDPASKIGSQIVETIRVHQKINKYDAYAAGIRALEKMNLPRCEQLMNSYPHTLSGGMLQRIMIALSLLHEPDIIIADEATTALDVVNQNVILDELKKMKEHGIGLLVVTHDFGVAAKIADDVMVMREGEIIERGTAYEVFTAPRKPYTKELLESSVLTREKRGDWKAGYIPCLPER